MNLSALTRRLREEAQDWVRQESGEPVRATEVHLAGRPADYAVPFALAFQIVVADPPVVKRVYTVVVTESTG